MRMVLERREKEKKRALLPLCCAADPTKVRCCTLLHGVAAALACRAASLYTGCASSHCCALHDTPCNSANRVCRVHSTNASAGRQATNRACRLDKPQLRFIAPYRVYCALLRHIVSYPLLMPLIASYCVYCVFLPFCVLLRLLCPF